MSIFLIGFMGSGKSFWGHRWAAKYNLPFSDLDDEIALQEGHSVLDIFEVKGEDYFREIESKQLRNLSREANHIIACGGGTPCFHNNIEWMNRHGTTIYLMAEPAQLLENILREKDNRPLVKDLKEAELLSFIEQRLGLRVKFYEQASLTIALKDVSDHSILPFISN